MTGFAELCATTNFSFLRGASHPEEMVLQAKELGLDGIGIADRNSLAGVVRAHAMAKEHKVRLIVGARLVFRDATPDIFVYPNDRAAYGRLTRLLTVGNMRAPKGECWLDFADFLEHAEGHRVVVIPALPAGAAPDEKLRACLRAARQATGNVWLAARFVFDGEDRRRLRLLDTLAHETGARLLATTEPLHHGPDRRALLDVVTCVREKVTLETGGQFLAPNAERHLKPAAEMRRLYRAIPHAVEESLLFLEGVTFSLDELSYQYPDETTEGYANAQEALEDLSWKGARWRYPDGIPEKVHEALTRELQIVAELKYASYFLTVADIVRYARKECAILCQGRGSAANSVICFCLGVTAVDPHRHKLLFDRFISTERNEPPDIDVDFEHERREEAIQYVYRKYGRHRAALAATVIRYQGRSAIRDVCKAFNYSEDTVTALAKTQQWWSGGVSAENLRELGLDQHDQRLWECLRLSQELKTFPRHLSQHVGGFVITKGRLDDVVPIQNAAMDARTVVEWNKDDLEELKILKVDLLGLGMLTCLRKAFEMIGTHYPEWTKVRQKLDLDTLPKEEPEVYRMLNRADSIGVFQVESRAQMSMLPRLQPKEFYDLVIEVAIVRPGPIQGGMVHPYLKRRQKLEKIEYKSPELREVLKRTLGVPLFQEQAMEIAIVGAGFSPAEADRLRRAMATFKRVGAIKKLRDSFIDGMTGKGYERDFAEACFRQIEGFGDYGFPESHAQSFALLVYASSWVKCHYPDVFAAALLNAQPMGFYAPAQIVRDAEEHGVEVRAPDINHSVWNNTLEPAPRGTINTRHAGMHDDIQTRNALRLGFRQISGLKEEEMTAFTLARGNGYDSVRDAWLRSELSAAALERLADSDAFRSIGLDRRDALWAIRGLNRVGGQEDLPIFAHAMQRNQEPDFALPPLLVGEQVVEDYRTIGLSLKAHPVALLRDAFAARKVLRATDLDKIESGRRVRVGGLVLVRQRPGTASGVIFMTLEDETHIANIIVWPRVFEQFRRQVLGARLCAVDGVVQKESGVIHVIAERLHDYSPLLAGLSAAPLAETTARADEVRRPGADARTHPRNVRHDLLWTDVENVMPKGRNFH